MGDDKLTIELAPIPAVADSDLFPVYDISDGSSERLKKITASNLAAYWYNSFDPNFANAITIAETAAQTGWLSGDNGGLYFLLQTSVVTSQFGQNMTIEAGSQFLGSGSGHVQFLLFRDAVLVAVSDGLGFNNIAYGNSTLEGAGRIGYYPPSIQSTSYTFELRVHTLGVGEQAKFSNRYIYSTESNY